MINYLMMKDLAHERRQELERLLVEARRIAEAERAQRSSDQTPHFARINHGLRRSLSHSLGIMARRAVGVCLASLRRNPAA